MQSYWRKIATPIIAKVIRESSPEELKKNLREAYPFGERARHPYKIWLDEIKRQTRGKKFKGKIDPNQQNLF